MLAEQFAAFFNRADSMGGAGVCNGCQMMANLAPIIPGAGAWPKFTRNQSEQYEGRLVTVQVESSPSIFYAGMEGSRIPIVVAHGEGYADFSQQGDIGKAAVGLRYVDNPRPGHADLPAEPERLAAGHRFGDDARWPLHRADAAPGTRVPRRADELAPEGLGKRRRRQQPVDAHVPQRPQVDGLSGSRQREKARRGKLRRAFSLRCGHGAKGRCASRKRRSTPAASAL